MKKRFSAKTVFAVLFLVAIFFVFVTAFYPVFFAEKKVNPYKEYFSSSQAYPFAKSSASASSSASSAATSSSVAQKRSLASDLAKIKKKAETLSKSIADQQENIEGYITDDYPYDMFFIKTEKRFEKLAGFNATTSACRFSNSKSTANDVPIELTDGTLGNITDNYKVTKKAEKVVQFAAYLKKKNINFLIFEVPNKGEEYLISKKYKGAYHDYSREKLQELFGIMDQNGVDYLSYTYHIDEMGWNKSDLFFKTDHHWLPQTALDACSLLTEKLNQSYGYDIDTSVYDMDQYSVTYTDPIFLGSIGRKVTEVYTDTERMPIILPKYDTDVEVFLSRSNKTTTGTVEETLMDYSELDPSRFGNSIYNMNLYRFYGYGNMQMVSIHNRNLHNGKRILFIRTSYVNAMLPYICNSAEYVDAIDLRYFKGSVKTLIKKTNPDTVVLAYGTALFESNNSKFFSFQ